MYFCPTGAPHTERTGDGENHHESEKDLRNPLHRVEKTLNRFGSFFFHRSMVHSRGMQPTTVRGVSTRVFPTVSMGLYLCLQIRQTRLLMLPRPLSLTPEHRSTIPSETPSSYVMPFTSEGIGST